jgi:hypothetical protein
MKRVSTSASLLALFSAFLSFESIFHEKGKHLRLPSGSIFGLFGLRRLHLVVPDGGAQNSLIHLFNL